MCEKSNTACSLKHLASYTWFNEQQEEDKQLAEDDIMDVSTG